MRLYKHYEKKSPKTKYESQYENILKIFYNSNNIYRMIGLSILLPLTIIHNFRCINAIHLKSYYAN